MPYSKWKLFSAAKYGDLKAGKRAVEKGIDVNVLDNEGKNAVHWAVRHKQFEICRWLVQDKKANANVVDNDGMTPLMYAAKYDNTPAEFVSLLVNDGGADPNEQSKFGRPLLVVAKKGAVDTGRALIVEAKADAGIVDGDGQNVWHRCATNPTPEFAKMLAELGVGGLNKLDRWGNTPLGLAISYYSHYTRQKTAEFLAQNGADVNLPGRHGLSPLHLAASRSGLALTKILIEAGADPNARDKHGKTVLHKAVVLENRLLRKEINYAHWLIDNCKLDWAATDENGDTALDFALKSGRFSFSVIEKLRPLVEKACWEKALRCVLTEPMGASLLPKLVAQLMRGQIVSDSKKEATRKPMVNRVWEVLRERPDLLNGGATLAQPNDRNDSANDSRMNDETSVTTKREREEVVVDEQLHKEKKLRQE